MADTCKMLNRYASHHTLWAVDVRGTADADAVLLVNDGLAQREGPKFYRAVPVYNAHLVANDQY